MGNIVQLQDFSVHDGDGIRTTIFLAGCPLRCKWCANPESWTQGPKLAFFEEKCVGCGLCAEVCPHGFLQGLPAGNASGEGRTAGRRESKGCGVRQGCAAGSGCDLCGSCARRCPQGALSVMGTRMSVAEVVRQVQRDSLFYGRSGGGVTFSGGEATVQTDFLRALSGALYDRGISLWLETCGFFSFAETADILGRMDHIFFDLKHMDSTVHREMTGVGNEEILKNCKSVYDMNIPLTLRIPVIPEVNLGEKNLRATASFICEQTPEAELELLPYHTYGVSKYKALRMCGDSGGAFSVPSKEQLEYAAGIFTDYGISVVEYR